MAKTHKVAIKGNFDSAVACEFTVSADGVTVNKLQVRKCNAEGTEYTYATKSDDTVTLDFVTLMTYVLRMVVIDSVGRKALPLGLPLAAVFNYSGRATAVVQQLTPTQVKAVRNIARAFGLGGNTDRAKLRAVLDNKAASAALTAICPELAS